MQQVHDGRFNLWWIKALLALGHISGAAACFCLPFTWTTSPLDVFREFTNPASWRDLWPLLVLAGGFLAPAVVAIAQCRSLWRGRWSVAERRAALVASLLWSSVLAWILWLMLIQERPPNKLSEYILTAIVAASVLLLSLVRLGLWQFRPLPPALASLIWLRVPFVCHGVTMLVAFHDDWASGAYATLAM
jgi:hypothetical protein